MALECLWMWTYIFQAEYQEELGELIGGLNKK